VATFNRSEGLRRLLEALKLQTIGPERFEVIVVDDGSTDDTRAVLTAFDAPYRLKWLWQRNQGPGAARNAAIEAASGDIIVTQDDDVEPAPDLLMRHLEAHARESGIAVIGRFAPPARGEALQPWTEWEFAGLERQYEAMIKGEWPPTPRQFYTANSSVPRWAYLEAGMFDQLFRRAEDVELAYRLRDLGLQFRFLPSALIYHRPRRTLAGWRRIASQYGFYDVIMARQKGRAHILPLIRHEFHRERPRVVQLLARLLVGRRAALSAWLRVAEGAAFILACMSIKRISQPLYSAIFNLTYWQGVSDALGGGRKVFLEVVSSERRPD
jgi:glycosyltransferase involved in cell wall biosynthesis